MVLVRDGQTAVMLAPELQFEEDVAIDFGTVSTVYYWDNGQWVTVETIDADQDEEVREILVDHFSRWAWYLWVGLKGCSYRQSCSPSTWALDSKGIEFL